jgi:glutamate-1-semialdehyde 2,1-aminomutase
MLLRAPPDAAIVERSMKPRQHDKLLASLAADYERRSPRSAAVNRDALRHLVDGGSHAIRLLTPFPPRITAAHGACVVDEDGHSILDFWQGHHANILGHNPAVITGALASAFGTGFGLQTGFTDSLQARVAEIFCERTGAEKVRFTTSGSLATMYATMLARGFTGRECVMKVAGGWHGAQPWGLVGVDYHEEGAHNFEQAESRGLPGAVAEQVIVTRWNDPRMLEELFDAHGARVACLIMEPFMGSAGCLPASRAFITAARELTRKHGAVLIFDEVIAGFRFCAGSASRLIGVTPDLATYAKIMGGGMPVAAVGGRADIMAQAGKGGGVKFSGGTYSCHPASMLASREMMEHLVAHEREIYPRIAGLGAEARRTVEEAFRSAGIPVRCTGGGSDALPAGSLSAAHFPYEEGTACDTPEQTRNPSVCDVALSDRVVQLALLLEDVFVMHGLGSVSAAHTEADIARLGEACGRVARRIAPHL